MKATSLIGTLALMLVTGPSIAKGHAKDHEKHLKATHPRAPTAMHTTQVHQRQAITPKVALKTEVKLPPPPKPCLHEPVTIGRGTEEDHFSLTRCDGSATPEGVDHLSVLARADNVLRPAHHGGTMPAGVRRVDARLAERLQQVADHFGKDGHPVSMHIVSGVRPMSAGSFHSTAQALDFRVDGVNNEQLVAFCKTLPDTGCGYYPNSSFVHLDVRASGTGHVSWIDGSGPGESPHYVSAWPPPPEPKNEAVSEDFAAKLERILPPLPIDEHPAAVRTELDAEASAAATRRVH